MLVGVGVGVGVVSMSVSVSVSEIDLSCLIDLSRLINLHAIGGVTAFAYLVKTAQKLLTQKPVYYCVTSSLICMLILGGVEHGYWAACVIIMVRTW